MRVPGPVWWIALALSSILATGPGLAATPDPAVPDPRSQAKALTTEADQRLAEPTAESLVAAVDLYRRAIELWQEVGDTVEAAEAHLALGSVYDQQGEIQRAIAAYEDADALAREAGVPNLEVRALIGIARALGVAGEGRRAVSTLERARGVLREHPDRESEAYVVFHLAMAQERQGSFQDALENYHQVLPILRELGLLNGVAATLNNLGTVAYELGDFDESRRFYQQAVTIRRQMQDIPGEARAWTRIGEVDQARGALDSAREHFRRALDLARRAGDRRAEANTSNFLGQAYLDLGEPERARGFLEPALALSRELPAPRIEAFSLELLGRLHALLGNLEIALEHYARAAATRRSTGHLRGEARALSESAELRLRLGQLDTALAETTAALEILESLRSRTTRQELRTSLFAAQRTLHELHVEVLMAKHRRQPAAGHDAEALVRVERSRARSLLDQLVESTVDLHRGVAPELVELERDLGERLDAKASELLWMDEGLSEAPLAAGIEREEALTAQVEALVTELRRVRGRIRHQSPVYADLSPPQTLDAAAIRRQLDPDSLLLVFHLGEERSYLWAVTHEQLTSHTLPPRAAIEAAAFEVYRLVTARNRGPVEESVAERLQRLAAAEARLVDAAHQLGLLVLAPLADTLGRQRLVVVGDGLLHIVPFAMLPLPHGEPPLGTPMITRHEVVHLPSVSALAWLRRADRRPPATKSLLVLADPVFQRDTRFRDTEGESTRGFRPAGSARASRLSRLRFSRREAEGLARLVPAGEATVLVDFAAGRAGLLDAGIEKFRRIHFATHALVDDERPELSGLVLSRFDARGQPQPAFLRLHEIQRLRLAADLVTLSACETALGRPVDGEGVVGMVHGFLHAGAERVVASLWSVQDQATAELMKRFYRAMLTEGQRPAAALRQAQIALRDDSRFAAPYFWAPFVLQGEWR